MEKSSRGAELEEDMRRKTTQQETRLRSSCYLIGRTWVGIMLVNNEDGG